MNEIDLDNFHKPKTLPAISLSTSLKGIVVCLVLAAMMSGLFLAGAWLGVMDQIEDRFIDNLFFLQYEKQKASPDIVIVFLDEAPVDHAGHQLSVSRLKLARLLEELKAKGARVIGIDILLDRPGPSSEDRRLMQVLQNIGRDVVLVDTVLSNRVPDEQYDHLDQFARFADVGNADVLVSPDDVVRRVWLGNQEKPATFAEVVTAKYLGVELAEAPWKKPATAYPLRINYLGPPDNLMNQEPIFISISSKDVPNAIDRLFEGKIVLIGANRSEDKHKTPFSSWLKEYREADGIQIQATIVDMLLRQRLLREATLKERAIICFIAGCITLMGLSLLRPPFNILIPLMMGLLLPVFSIGVFLQFSWIVPVIMIEIILFLIVVATLIFLHYNVLRHHRLLQGLSQRIERSLTRSQKEIQRLSSHQLEVIEGERSRIARELHDEMGQTLASIKLDLSNLTRQFGPEHSMYQRKTLDLIEQVNSGLRSIKQIIAELRPRILEDLGIAAAVERLIEEFTNKSGIDCYLVSESDDIDLDQNLAMDCFRMIQEMLTNVVKHSRASMVRVTIQQNGMLIIRVTDNGTGLQKKDAFPADSFGLLGIKERVGKYNGSIKIRGLKNLGTSIQIRIPIK